MPRQARLDVHGTLHHVMIRGIEGTDIFCDNEDRGDFTSRISSLVGRTDTRIVAWALMTNHVHLLLLSGQSGLSSFMRSLLTGYAIRFNRRHQRTGHLFQNRYKSIICEEEIYLLQLIRYIHLNPLRAKIVKTIEELDHYRWCGHCVLMGKEKNDWLDIEYVLKQFGQDKGKAIVAYRKFVQEGIEEGHRPDLVGGGLIRSLGGWSQVLSLRGKNEKIEFDSRILGSGDFVRKILKDADKKLDRQLQYSRRKETVDDAIERICKKHGIKEVELREGGKRREVTKVRGEIAYYLSREMGVTLAEIARNVGVGTSAVAMALKKKEVEKLILCELQVSEE